MMEDLCGAGRSGPQAMAAFVGMWAAMMVPMMLPSVAPALHRCASIRNAAATALGYFTVWTAVGVAVYPVAGALARVEMRLPYLPGIAVAAAGLLQFTAWKVRRLACSGPAPADGGGWRHGLRLGARCVARCANLMAVLLLVGMMDVVAMTAVTLAVSVERYVPRAAPAIGGLVVGAGVLLAVQAL